MTEEKNDGGSACGSESCCKGPGKWIWIILVLAIAGVLIAKNKGNTPAVVVQTVAPKVTSQGNSLPRLLDLGAGKCVPCKKMVPILEDLKKAYTGKLDVVFIDVWENQDAGKQYGIRLIPTQIFFDAQGKELFRHEGFFAKEDILAKWKEFGVELPSMATVPKIDNGRGAN